MESMCKLMCTVKEEIRNYIKLICTYTLDTATLLHLHQRILVPQTLTGPKDLRHNWQSVLYGREVNSSGSFQYFEAIQ